MASEQTRAVASVFDLVAPDYDRAATRFFPFSADRMVNILRPRPGSRVLDVATGTGMAALSLAQAIGPQGRVHAIDLSERMLDQADANFKRAGVTHIDLHVMDAGSLDFRRDYFDTVACAYGLFFLDDMVSGLKEWVRVAKPAATVGFSCFTSSAFQPMSDLFRARLEQYGVATGGQPVRSAVERLYETSECESLMREAGLDQISVETHPLGYHLNSADEWWEIVTSTAYRGLIESIAANSLESFRKEHLAEVAALAESDGIWLDATSHYVTGYKPGKPA